MSQYPIKRRRFIAGASATLGALALRGYPVFADEAVHFTHGVASGDPLTDRVILWTRVLPGDGAAEELPVTWEVATDDYFNNVVASGETTTGMHRDYTVKVDAAGLQPGSRYFYRFAAKGVNSLTGETQTLPEGRADRVRLAVVSCSNYPQGYFHVYRKLASNRFINAVVHLGDYIYEYGEGGYANPEMLEKGRNVKPEHEIVSLEDYRMRYGLYRTDPDLQRCHRMHPFICTWDDHEITNNTWKAGAENHNDGEGAFDARRRAAIQAFHEWLPVREQGSIEQGKIYRSFDYGNLFSLIMLDTRLVGRDEQLSHDMDADSLRTALADRGRSILGPEQEAWLESELKRSARSGRPWQILGQQVLMGKNFIPQIPDEEFAPEALEAVMANGYGELRERGRQGFALNMDAWDGYPACRERVFDDFRKDANNVVVLAGDTHSSWAFDLQNKQGEAVGVEFATPSITSPGFESLLPIAPERLEQATMDVSPELKYFKADGRGWMELDITPEEVSATWKYVSTVHEEDYEVIDGPTLTTRKGGHAIAPEKPPAPKKG